MDLIQGLMAATMPTYINKLDEARGDKLREFANQTRQLDPQNMVNLGVALDALLITDQNLFEEVAYLQRTKSKSEYLDNYYKRFATPDMGGKTTFQRASEITATAGGGNADFSTLYVENVIKKRVETESNLLSYLDSKRLTTTTGKFPKSSNVAKCGFGNTDDTLTDITATVDGGFGHISVEAQKFGGLLKLTAEAFAKLNAQTISQIIDELTIAYHRGMIDQIINGNGSTPNATGFATNATSVTYQGNTTLTLIKMIAAIADVTRGGMKDIFIVTNTAGKTSLLAEKFISPAYDNILAGVLLGMDANKFIESLPIIEENVIVTSGSSPNKTAPLYVGKTGDYLIATNTDPQIMVDQYSGFTSGTENIRIMNFWTSAPYFNDSFAKTTIPTLY